MLVTARVPGDDPEPTTREGEVAAEQAVIDFSRKIEGIVKDHAGVDFTEPPSSEQDDSGRFGKQPKRTYTYNYIVEIDGDNGTKTTEKTVRSYFDRLGDKIKDIPGVDKHVDFTTTAM